MHLAGLAVLHACEGEDLIRLWPCRAQLNRPAPRGTMVQRNFDPGFFVEHFEKDLGIALDECKRMGVAMPGLALVRQFYVALKSQGHGRKGYHALLLVLEQLSAIQR